MPDETAVSRALADYYSAFSTLDIEAILPFFNEPSLFLGPPGALAAPTSAAIAPILASTIEDLRKREYGHSELSLREVKHLSATTAMATGVAVRYKIDGAVLERVGITYLLHKLNGAWKIVVVALHDIL